jgi:hypothetical protein
MSLLLPIIYQALTTRLTAIPRLADAFSTIYPVTVTGYWTKAGAIMDKLWFNPASAASCGSLVVRSFR